MIPEVIYTLPKNIVTILTYSQVVTMLLTIRKMTSNVCPLFKQYCHGNKDLQQRASGARLHGAVARAAATRGAGAASAAPRLSRAGSCTRPPRDRWTSRAVTYTPTFLYGKH